MTSVGFIGPGIMGGPMIKNLVVAGHRVRAPGRSPASVARVHDAGAELAESVAEVAAGADVVITMLPDTPDVERVVRGPGGLLESLKTAQTYVDMSTIRVDVTRSLSQDLLDAGVHMLDAPVSGGEPAAKEGTLSVMVGGDPGALDRVRGILDAVSTSVVHVGPSGSGQLTKAANQLIVAANIQAVAEAIVLLETSGCDVEKALAAIGGGLAGSTVLQRKAPAFLTGEFKPGFRVALHDKDLGIVQATARDLGVALPMAALVTQLMAALKARGDGGLDHSALLKLTRELNTPAG